MAGKTLSLVLNRFFITNGALDMALPFANAIVPNLLNKIFCSKSSDSSPHSARHVSSIFFCLGLMRIHAGVYPKNKEIQQLAFLSYIFEVSYLWIESTMFDRPLSGKFLKRVFPGCVVAALILLIRVLKL